MKKFSVFLLRLLFLGCIIPTILSTVAYKGFTTNYTTGVFSRQGFENQYENGIYRYRILGRIMLLKTHDLVKEYDLPTISPLSLKLLDEQGDELFYTAYFYLNTFFLCLTSLILIVLLDGNRTEAFIMVDLPLLCMCFLMTITQYVVVPYDILSYFFLAVSTLLIIRGNQSAWNLFVLCCVVVLATLTRETAILILAFYLAIHHSAILTNPKTFRVNRQQTALLILSVCFGCTYVALRFLLGFENAIFQDLWLFGKANLYSTMSILFLIGITLLCAVTKVLTKELTVFVAASLPYILAMMLTASLWEIRIWTPVVLLLVILKVRAAQHEVSHS